MLRRPRFPGALPAILTLTASIFGLGLMGLSGDARAADAPKLLGKFDDWEAYTFGSGDSLICFVLSEPKTMLPAGATRGDAYFMITHRPAQKIRNEVSLRAGYAYSATSKPFATIGSAKFQMFSGVNEGGEQKSWAWLDNVSQETAMVKALRGGSNMVVKGTSERGTLTTDTYSLKGSSAAINKIDEACK